MPYFRDLCVLNGYERFGEDRTTGKGWSDVGERAIQAE